MVISPPALFDFIRVAGAFTGSRFVFDVRSAVAPVLTRRLDFFFGRDFGSALLDDFGISLTTSFAGLSSRRPWNDGCRSWPSDVHSVNSISPTRSGFTQVTPRPL